jgi:TRAP-type mannitol/chloroaromatic compound transport system permease large subunit
VIIVAKLKPKLAPPLPLAERYVPLPALSEKLAPSHASRALPTLLKALKGQRNAEVPTSYILKQLGIVLLPAILFLFVAVASYSSVTTLPVVEDTSELQAMGTSAGAGEEVEEVEEAEDAGGLSAPPGAESDEEVAEPAAAEAEPAEPQAQEAPAEPVASGGGETERSKPAPAGFWIGLAVGALALLVYYALLSFTRLEVFKMLLTSFFPLLVLILAVLGSIVMGLATPTEAAAVGALGGLLLAFAYRQLTLEVVKESVFLTAKTSAMVCWLFVGSAIFSAAFALLGGQELVENWVMSMNLSKTQFLVLSQVIIFILGWPLEWTEIIVIFMPIFIPLLDNFGVDPLFFGLLVALNLQTAFLSPPVAMSAFYLKGVSPPHVTLNQIFAGMLPFMGIQILAIFLLYQFPGIGLWLPELLYK